VRVTTEGVAAMGRPGCSIACCTTAVGELLRGLREARRLLALVPSCASSPRGSCSGFFLPLPRVFPLLLHLISPVVCPLPRNTLGGEGESEVGGRVEARARARARARLTRS
jgi:hypothetical protein